MGTLDVYPRSLGHQINWMAGREAVGCVYESYGSSLWREIHTTSDLLFFFHFSPLILQILGETSS